MAFNLAIGFVNATGVYDIDYMEQDLNQTYDLSDISESVGDNSSTGVIDYFMTMVTLFITGLAFIKDFAIGMVYIYPTLVDSFGMPEAVAVPIQTIIAISWFVFFIQLIMRDSWKGKE